MVGSWRVQPTLNRLSKEEASIRIPPRLMEVLQCLAAHPGEVVERETLLTTAWKGVFVEDIALTQTISHLRKVFHDDPRQPRYIETIPKRGYRLVALVRRSPLLPDDPAHHPTLPEKAPWRPRPSQVAWGAGLLSVATVLLLLIASQEPLTLSHHPPQAVPVTSYPGLELDPALSPDGARVIFAWQDSPEAPFNLHIKTLSAATSRQLTKGEADDMYPVWSPDGHQIVFARLIHGKCNLVLLSLHDGSTRTLTPCGLEAQPRVSWSPDGTRLALSDRPARGEPYRLSMMSLSTLQSTVLTQPVATSIGDRFPTFAPDGQAIAFVRVQPDNRADLYVLTLRDNHIRQLTTDRAAIQGVDWTPDGRALVVASAREGKTNLWTIPLRGGTPTWLSGDVAWAPSVSRGRPRMVYARMSGNASIWRIDHSEEKGQRPARPILQSTYWEHAPQISPQGEHIAFISARSGHHELWVSDHDGANPIQLSAFEGPVPGHPRWSPEGRRLTFDVQSEDQTDIYTVGLWGGVPRRLTDGRAHYRAPSWSRDGAMIYASSNRTGAWQLWKISLQEGTISLVTPHRVLTAQETPDGQGLYFTRPDSAGLWHLDLATGARHRVIQELSTEDWWNWSVAEDGIYFIKQCPAPGPHIARYDPETEIVEHLASLPARIVNGASFGVAPGGTWSLFTQPDGWQSDIMLLEDL